MTFRSANVVKPFLSMQKVVSAGNIVVLNGKNPHIRCTRDGPVIKLDAVDMCVCLDETVPVFTWQKQ